MFAFGVWNCLRLCIIDFCPFETLVLSDSVPEEEDGFPLLTMLTLVLSDLVPEEKDVFPQQCLPRPLKQCFSVILFL